MIKFLFINMKFNRKKLEELTLEKIKEVNDEAGYRSYLEVPEMVEIIASIMEKKMKVFHDSDAELIKSLRDDVKKLDEENEYLSDFKAAAEEELKDWEACADRLFVYAMETLSTATNMALYEVAKEDVLEYNRLKSETQSNESTNRT